ncbi:MAG: NTP transferase domain-containing protein [Desulfurococcales archaeon]|nr:NTP transferase domain-containing protein [Desulfurococcales archaeon]
MIAVIMAGGRASRMGGVVKPILDVCGAPLILHVARAVDGMVRLKVLALSSYTIEHLKHYCSMMECIQTPGAGYPEDLSLILKTISYRPLLVLPADLAYLDEEILKDLASKAGEVRGDIVTMTCRGEPQGISIVKGYGDTWVSIEEPCNHINVNSWKSLEEARRRCENMEVHHRQGQ